MLEFVREWFWNHCYVCCRWIHPVPEVQHAVDLKPITTSSSEPSDTDEDDAQSIEKNIDDMLQDDKSKYFFIFFSQVSEIKHFFYSSINHRRHRDYVFCLIL